MNDDDPSVNSQTTTVHLVTQLLHTGISWRGYEESIPGGACPLTNTGPTDSSGDPEYAVRHEPFCFFDDVTRTQNTACAYCIANVVSYTRLTGDLTSNTVARYNFLTLNLCDDMHDTCTPLNNEILQGDTWLSENLPPILVSQAYLSGGVVFITWDEGEGGDGPIGMIVLSPVGKGGGYNNAIHYTHSSTLRTVQEILGVGPLLGDAANATDLSDLFQTGPSLNGNQYRALFTNSCGSVTSSVATLLLNIPPAITNQPSTQTVCNGQSAQFVVGATGTGPLTYQWQRVGWGAGWQLDTTGTNGTGGFFIGSSTANGGGDPDGTGDIDTSHQAWGMYANAGALSEAIRPFNGLLAITSPLDQTYILTNTVAVTGIASAVAGITGVTVNGTPATSVNAFTNWTATIAGLVPCTNTLTVVATDAGGNSLTNISTVIAAIRSMDCNGDGLPDAWQIQYFGCTSCPQAAPSADPDHDGFTNLEEFQVGTDPTNALSSLFRISSITRQSNNVLLVWTAAGGSSNVVQATSGNGGSYSTNFANVSPLIIVAGSSLTSTNYVDAGGATNMPARYYHVVMLLASQSQTVITQAIDNAADPAYSGSWTNGSNGGTGFGP